ncbi:unnamed protein product [Cyclocybe aegerita]|uniref:DUF6533 domain-containing protein n=1 Tax=Cyclocybe aegerita TaxID=1973307 RepID=A0A8S0WH53_CYCAE|nr:unnamed protein product [Cyclocybe aegerita]
MKAVGERSLLTFVGMNDRHQTRLTASSTLECQVRSLWGYSSSPSSTLQTSARQRTGCPEKRVGPSHVYLFRVPSIKKSDCFSPHDFFATFSFVLSCRSEALLVRRLSGILERPFSTAASCLDERAGCEAASERRFGFYRSMYIYSDEYQLGACVLIASATVLVFDFFLTLHEEINHIWMQPWTPGTVIFLVNRYLPFVDTSMVLYLQFTTTNIDMCNTYYHVSTWLIAVGLMVSELILLLRTYAMWQRRRIILYILGGMSFATFGPGIALTYLELRSLEFGEVPEGGLGCRLLKASKLIFVTYVLVALSETVVVVLTLMKGKEHLRSSQASWVKHIYRHGLLFYMYLLSITIMNVVVPLVVAEPQYKNYLAIPQRIFHSVFCNRVILLISRQRSYRVYTDRLEMTRPRSITKTNLTGNMLDTAIGTTYERREGDVDMLSDTAEGMEERDVFGSGSGTGTSAGLGGIGMDDREQQHRVHDLSLVYRQDWTR